MPGTRPNKPRRPKNADPDGSEPRSPPVEPDEGLVPPVIPADPEHERVVNPAD